jgi:glycosyltransferase involved in cell wall biosynthesis
VEPFARFPLPPMPRLLMILHDFYPEESRVVAEARAAVAAGFEVDVLALRGPDERALETLDGVHVIRMPIGHRHGASAVALAAEYIRSTLLGGLKAARLSLRGRYDIVHVHNPPDFLVLAAAVPRLRGAKMIVDFHDLTADMYMMRFGNRRGGLIDKALHFVERTAARSADAVITVHEAYREQLARNGVRTDAITVVMNSLDERVLHAAQDAPRGSTTNDVFRVVHHGTVTPHYGVELIVEAVAQARDRVPNIRLELYGSGDALPAVTAHIESLGLADISTLVPRFLRQEDVVARVQGAAAGVAANLPIPLNRFALPTKLLEYVALGIPAIAPDLPTIRSHFDDDEIWYFTGGDATALADALVALAMDPTEAADRARRAQARYEAYTWRRSEAVYTELLRRLTGGAGHAPTASSA